MNTDKIFSISNTSDFSELAIEIFNHQAKNCLIYNQYLKHLRIDVEKVSKIEDIPFLPISFFKTQKIISGNQNPQIIFTSSGTTGSVSSKHHVTDVSLYERSYLDAFKTFYGQVNEYCILALLPSYQQREGSSLIYMVNDLIEKSNHPKSGYFLYNHNDLYNTLTELKATNQKTILIGVTYALLDFIENYSLNFPDLIIMETGGMKGKRKEMVRAELHDQIISGFGVTSVHSEYGMSELLTQAYSLGDGIFHCPAWMHILIRETNDPLTLAQPGKSGGINVIDLANINSCSFIATQDLGKKYDNGSFEVLGRFDHADIRGCNLLVQ